VLPGLADPYSYQFIGEGATPPYTFSAATPDDQSIIDDAGFTLSSSGLLTGSPITTDPVTFSVKITDSSGLTCTKQFTIPMAAIDWSLLHWVTGGINTVHANWFVNGVHVPLGAPSPATDCGTQSSIEASYNPNGDIVVFFSPTVTYGGSVPVNCRMRVELFTTVPQPDHVITIRVDVDGVFLPQFIPAYHISNLPLGTTDVNFTVPANGNLITVSLDFGTVPVGAQAYHFKITFMNV
jgi:hypothetical protein